MNENPKELENSEEVIEETEATEEETETTQEIDYSSLLQDIITNQETIIQQNNDILLTENKINNACLGVVNIVTLGAIICVAMFIVKNIFAKLF